MTGTQKYWKQIITVTFILIECVMEERELLVCNYLGVGNNFLKLFSKGIGGSR